LNVITFNFLQFL